MAQNFARFRAVVAVGWRLLVRQNTKQPAQFLVKREDKVRHHQHRPRAAQSCMSLVGLQPDIPSQPCNGSKSITEQELAGSGLRTFIRISEKWQMSPEQQSSLLGCEDRRILDSWRRSDCADVPHDVLIRISYVLGIYKALHTIFPNALQADGWIMRRPPAFSSGAI